MTKRQDRQSKAFVQNINSIVLTGLFLLIANAMLGQPCNFPFSPSNTCATAPLICNLDGFCSRNENAVNSGTPNAFCGQVENNNWVAFIAGSTTFEIQITVSNCVQNNGLQAQFFSTSDCNNYTAVSNCLDPVLGSGNLTCSNLEIGVQYYLMMDGKGGDVCDYTYTLISGTILSPASVFIDPVPPLCTGKTTTITSTAVSANANLNYLWTTLDGNIISDPTAPSIEVDAGGIYSVNIEDANGCKASTDVGVVEVADYSLMILSPDVLNCESNVTETLEAIVSQPPGLNFDFLWTSNTAQIVSGENTATPIVDQPGIYTVLVTDNFGCSKTEGVQVFADVNTPFANAGEDEELNCITPSVELNTNLSSLGQDFAYQWNTPDGNIVSGGNTTMAIVDAPGTYELVVTNLINGCTANDFVDVILNDAAPNDALIRSIQPCFGEIKGEIIIDSVIGGTAPYLYAFDTLAFTGTNVLKPAYIDVHTVTIQDATGCEWSTEVDIQAQPEFLVDLGPNQSIPLGCPAEINAQVNFPLQQIDTLIWNTDMVCSPVCDTNIILFRETIFRVQAIDINGCTTNGAVNVFIEKDRNVFIPNAFSPNGDGVNDLFTVLGGKDVELVKTFRVFNRWGALVHQQDNFPANDPSAAWNGRLNDQYSGEQVFIYYAEVLFIDGWIETYQGDVTIIR